MAENFVLPLVFAERFMVSQEGLWSMELVWILVENIIIIIIIIIIIVIEQKVLGSSKY